MHSNPCEILETISYRSQRLSEAEDVSQRRSDDERNVRDMLGKETKETEDLRRKLALTSKQVGCVRVPGAIICIFIYVFI